MTRGHSTPKSMETTTNSQQKQRMDHLIPETTLSSPNIPPKSEHLPSQAESILVRAHQNFDFNPFLLSQAAFLLHMHACLHPHLGLALSPSVPIGLLLINSCTAS